jgi:membrane protein DedA with SNARE-associated domain
VLEQLVSSFGATATTSILGPFLVLLICGLGLPVPEDIVLISAGILAAREGIPLLPVCVVMYIGIILGDSIVFFLGSKIGLRVLKTRLGAKFIGQNSVDRASDYIRRWGSPILLAARFMPGLRSPVFFTAGVLGFKYYRFLFLDSVAAILSAPFFVYLGYWSYHRFENDFSEIESRLSDWQPTILIVVGACALIAGTILLIRRKTVAAKGPQHEKS